jgi:hypothetical protein
MYGASRYYNFNQRRKMKPLTMIAAVIAFGIFMPLFFIAMVKLERWWKDEGKMDLKEKERKVKK